MSEPFDTALRERIARLPADPPTGWSTDLRARLATAWDADDIDAGSRPALVVDLATPPRRRPRRIWLVAAAATCATAAAAAAVFNAGGTKNVVETDVPPAGSDHPSVTAPAESLPSNGQLVIAAGSETPQLVGTDGTTSPPIPCADPCPGRAELWQLTDGDRWSPDGKQAAYTWDYGVYVLDVETGATRQVAGPCAGTDPLSFRMWDGTYTNPPGPGDPTFSPDGTRILYTGCSEVHVFSLGDGNDVRVTDVCELTLGCSDVRAPDYYYIAGRWSPDGRSIAVTIEDPPAHTSSVHVVDATTGSHRVVAPQGEFVGWGPDGRLVYWRGDRGPLGYEGDRLAYARDTDELRSIDSSGHDSLIARAPHGEVAPDLAHVAYITDYHDGAAEGGDVRVRDLESGADVLIERGERNGANEHRYEGVQWSPDGRRLAVSSDEHVIIVDPDGSHRVTHPQTERGGLAWLPRPRQ